MCLIQIGAKVCWKVASRNRTGNPWPSELGWCLLQCFPTLFLEAHQQYTFFMSPVSDPSISGLGVSTNELISWIRSVWLERVWKCVLCLHEQAWKTQVSCNSGATKGPGLLHFPHSAASTRLSKYTQPQMDELGTCTVPPTWLVLSQHSPCTCAIVREPFLWLQGRPLTLLMTKIASQGQCADSYKYTLGFRGVKLCSWRTTVLYNTPAQ